MITSEPQYETVILRDIQMGFVSGVRDFCLEPDDVMECQAHPSFPYAVPAKITIGGITFVPNLERLEWVTVGERQHRRKIDVKLGPK